MYWLVRLCRHFSFRMASPLRKVLLEIRLVMDGSSMSHSTDSIFLRTIDSESPCLITISNSETVGMFKPETTLPLVSMRNCGIFSDFIPNANSASFSSSANKMLSKCCMGTSAKHSPCTYNQGVISQSLTRQHLSPVMFLASSSVKRLCLLIKAIVARLADRVSLFSS